MDHDQGQQRAIAVRDLALLSAAFGASRALYYAAGARFDDRELGSFWHFIPEHLLRERLLESVLHLHFQPPLFNLYLGAMLKAFGPHAHAAFALSYALVGLGFAWSLLALMRASGVGRRVALGLCAALIVSPAHLLFESFLFYSYPVMAAVTLGALLLQLAAERGTTRAWLLAWTCLSGVVLTRALFHPLWLLGLVLAALALRARDRRQIARAAAVPLLIVALWCGKNWILFDTPGTSSWLGIGLARMALRDLPGTLRARWIAEGKLSPLAAIRPPGTLEQYAPLLPLPAPTGVALLDLREKPGGALNLHHLAYVEIARRLGRDARYAMRRRPDVYARSAVGALRRFVSPAADWHPLAPNRKRIARYADGYAAVLHFPSALGRSGLWLALVPGLAAFGAAGARRRLRADRHDARGLALAFMTVTIAYVTLTGCLLEPRENMRFRLLIEPFLYVLLGVALTRLGTAWRTRRARAAQPS